MIGGILLPGTSWTASTAGLRLSGRRYTRPPMTPTVTQTSGQPAPSRPVRERVFSGIQPSGASHLGNYLGSDLNYVKLQDEYDTIYGIVDLHALTTVHDGEEMRRLSHEMVLDLLAVGLARSE